MSIKQHIFSIGDGMTMISPAQMRMARAGLGWGVRELAERAGLQPGTISRIENGKEAMGGSLRKIEQTFGEAGVTFPDENTVSIKGLSGKAE
jgi:transcriptional regulator with XRE-family HTH domain